MSENIIPREALAANRRTVGDVVLGLLVKAQLLGMEIGTGVQKEDEPIHHLVMATTGSRPRSKLHHLLERGARASYDHIGKQFRSPAKLGAFGLAVAVRVWDLYGSAPPPGYIYPSRAVEQYDMHQGFTNNKDTSKDN